MDPVGLLISVVDDDESVRESLPDLLREFGFSAKAFASAQEFLESNSAKKTKCLILDVAMPGMSGPELKSELEKVGFSIPTIFITAHAEICSRPEVREGAVACLIKPFGDTALQDAVKRALNLKSK
jgi:FixJ family two-component response regulator